MANVINLPTADETNITFTIGDKQVTIDPVTCNDLVMAAIDLEKTTTGKNTEEGWRKFFISIFESTYNITLDEFQCWALTEKCAKELREWKKKLFPLPEQLNSTVSPVV